MLPVEVQLTERFEIAYNRIHKRLRKLVPMNKGGIFSQLVSQGAKRHSIIRNYKDELLQFAKLRNAIVHEKFQVDQYIAIPHEETVFRIERIAEELEKPKSVNSIAQSPVSFLYYDSSIKEMMSIIHKHSFTKFPVYKDGLCIGLLTAGAVMKWMAEHHTNYIINFSDVKVYDVFPYEGTHIVDFIGKNKNIFDVEELFEKYHSNNKKLEAVVVTNHGRQDEQPLGIITSWDLIDIVNE